MVLLAVNNAPRPVGELGSTVVHSPLYCSMIQALKIVIRPHGVHVLNITV